MKIYRFRKLTNEVDFCRLKQIIETGYFWCSNFWELNDSMEGVFSSSNLDIIKKIFSEKAKYKICSFSGIKGFKHIPMWGYYSGGFKGVAIEVEIDLKEGLCNHEGGIKKIKLDNSLPNDLDNIENILLNKSKEWKHEDEYRFLIKSDNNYHKIGVITAIYFGTPYDNLENSEQIFLEAIKQHNKSFVEYEEYKKRLKKIASKNNIKYPDVKINDGKIVKPN